MYSMKKAPFTITRSCTHPPDIERLREWCIIAGHWLGYDHKGNERVINESVLILCVHGGGWLRLRDEYYTVRKNDIFICPPNIPHVYGCNTDTGWEIWWCHFSGEHTVTLCRAIGLSEAAPLMQLPEPDQAVVCFSKLLDRLEDQQESAALDAADLLHSLLLELYRQAEKRPLLANLAQFANDRSISLNEMARRAGYSTFHFTRLFKKQTGRSPWQYVLDRKIERAKELLIGSSLSIKEISASLDFNNPDYFAKLFRSRCGTPPHKYRGR